MSRLEEKIQLLRTLLPALPLQSDISLAPYTTLQAGGNARWLAEIRDVHLLADAAAVAQANKIPHITIGSGSNILPSDKGYDGLVLVNSCKKIYFGRTQYCECGCWFQDLFLQAAQKGFEGLEFAVGIPGTLGGALVSNAGAYRANIADLLTEVELVQDGNRKWVEPDYLGFSYRDSILRRPNALAITLLAVKMQLRQGIPLEIYSRAKDYQRQRIIKQPPHPSAGSFFKNVQSYELVELLPGLPPGLKESGIVPAGYLVEACGLKGARIGGAKISERHANFLCNVESAKAQDIRNLASLVKKSVLEKFDVALEEEVLYIGDWGDGD